MSCNCQMSQDISVLLLKMQLHLQRATKRAEDVEPKIICKYKPCIKLNLLRGLHAQVSMANTLNGLGEQFDDLDRKR